MEFVKSPQDQVTEEEGIGGIELFADRDLGDCVSSAVAMLDCYP
jgi:hypothetical protein